jgi:hypothetical protein
LIPALFGAAIAAGIGFEIGFSAAFAFLYESSCVPFGDLLPLAAARF